MNNLVREVERIESRRWWYRRVTFDLVVVALVVMAYYLGSAHRERDRFAVLATDADSLVAHVVGPVMDSVRALVPPNCLVGARSKPECPEYGEALEAETDSAQYHRNQRDGIR